MTWYDDTVWVKEPGDRLILLMAQSFPANEDVRGLLEDIKCVEYLPGGSLNAKLKWTDVLPKLLDQRKLRSLLSRVVVVKPALSNDIDEIGKLATVISHNGQDPYQVLMIGPARLPLVDREDLRRAFKEFVERKFPVLLVVGPDRSGKTHSRELFRHVLEPLRDVDLRQVDFSSPSAGNDGSQLLSLLCHRLGMSDVSGRQRRTTRTRHAVDLVNVFVGKYKGPSNGRRVIVIDGLNRKDLEPDVHEVAAQLIAEAAGGNLSDTQLILAGYTGSFDPQVRYHVLKENIPAISRTHVKLFFKELGNDLGRKIPEQSLNGMVRTVMDGRPPIDEFGDRVRAEALKLEVTP